MGEDMEVARCFRTYFDAVCSYQHKPSTYMGVRIRKNPMDLCVMQELIWRVKPDWVVETGTCGGGSALAWAATLELLGRDEGRIITIDSVCREMPKHRIFRKRVEFVCLSSLNERAIEKVKSRVCGTVMVILDSRHSAEHVYQELETYAPLVTLDSYCIVEDGCMHRGPFSAVQKFLKKHPEFFSDLSVEPPFSFNSYGYLRRRSLE